jgi:hypothetical protein
MKHPDPKLHLQISLLKSAIRVCAGGAFIAGFVVSGGALIIIAEILGIWEELV